MSLLSEVGGVATAESLASTSLELTLIDFILEYFPAVEVFESEFELSDVLGGVGEEDSVAMDVVIEPLPDILHPVVVLQLVGLHPLKLTLLLLWDSLVFVVRQSQTMVERQVQFLQLRSCLLRHMGILIVLSLLGETRDWLGFFFLLDFERIVFLTDDCVVDGLLVNEGGR